MALNVGRDVMLAGEQLAPPRNDSSLALADSLNGFITFL